MPLTKVRYDMLDLEVTQKITESVANTGAGSPFVFTATTTDDGLKETLTGYKLTADGVTTVETVRRTDLVANQLVVTLATFTPVLGATATPGASLDWDQPATGFTVDVNNPADYTSKWIDSVVAIAAVNGSSISTTLSEYTAGNKSENPAGGVDWTQTFTTGGNSYIKSSSTDGTGGSATGRLTFTFDTADGAPQNYTTTKDFTVNWRTPQPSITLAALQNKTFLQTYTGSTFSPSISNMSNVASNCEFTVSATNVEDDVQPGVKPQGSHSITFKTPIHKTNASSTTTKVSVVAKITRPSSVTSTGNPYEVTLASVDSASVNTSAQFKYPSFTAWTTSTNTVPTRADCVAGDALDASFVTVLGDQQKTLAQNITNSSSDSRAYWFAVRASASQPTSFQTGAQKLGSETPLLSNVDKTEATINLEPDTPPTGYSAEAYKLYGITLQPGTTYVSIS